MNCRHCGCRLARDHRGALWCDPCYRARRDYDPRTDGEFLDALLCLFQAHAGEYIRPWRELGIHPEFKGSVKDAVRALRAQGHHIEARPKRPGYRYLPDTTSAPPV